MWRWITSANAMPLDQDLAVAVIDQDGVHALEAPCRRRAGCWVDAKTGRLLDVQPTHWREWAEAQRVHRPVGRGDRSV
jgi:hypothetical protein